ncbi:MAG: hypothetical protein ACRBF0_17985 [Calditrichia bacterium]
MKHYVKLGLWWAILSILILSGCQNDTSPLAESDEDIVAEMVTAEDEDFLYDVGIDDYSEDNMYDGYSTFDGNGKAPIENVTRFGRRVSERPRRGVRSFERIGPDSVKVSVARVFPGAFHILSVEDSNGTRVRTRYIKRLRHIVRRNAIFVKRADTTTDRRWKLAAISLGQGNSTPNASIRIQKVAIASSGGDSTVITDPLNTLLDTRDDVPTFMPGDEVTVTVYLENNTANPVADSTGATETVLLHYGVNREHHARSRFEYRGVDPATGYNVYVGRWTIGQRPFRAYHAIFDAIDNGTIYDDDGNTYPYNSTTWSTPYIVTGASTLK